jgi:hypothetical protein
MRMPSDTRPRQAAYFADGTHPRRPPLVSTMAKVSRVGIPENSPPVLWSPMLLHRAPQFLPCRLACLLVQVRALQLDPACLALLMCQAAVRHELRAMLAGHRFVGGIEAVFCAWRMHLQRRQDLLSTYRLGAAIPCTCLLGPEVIDEPGLNGAHGHGLHRLCSARWCLVVLTPWPSRIRCTQVSCARQGPRGVSVEALERKLCTKRNGVGCCVKGSRHVAHHAGFGMTAMAAGGRASQSEKGCVNLGQRHAPWGPRRWAGAAVCRAPHALSAVLRVRGSRGTKFAGADTRTGETSRPSAARRCPRVGVARNPVGQQ